MGQINRAAFLPGTTMGEAAWLIARALNTLAPIAPALFGRQRMTGELELDFDRWMEAATALAVDIQKRAEAMTPTAEDAAFTEGGEQWDR